MNKDARVFDIFGKRYFLPMNGNMTETKANILIEATLLFAKNGYAAVSVRDIAESVEITPGALYNHFTSKEALWMEILKHAETLLIQYGNDLGKHIEEASTFDEALELIFRGPRQMKNVYANYAFSMVLNEKLHESQAAKVYTETFYKKSIDMLSGWFDRFIEKGEIRQFDTRYAAIGVLNLLYSAVDAWALNSMDYGFDYDHTIYISAAEEIVRHLSGTNKE